MLPEKAIRIAGVGQDVKCALEKKRGKIKKVKVKGPSGSLQNFHDCINVMELKDDSEKQKRGRETITSSLTGRFSTTALDLVDLTSLTMNKHDTKDR